MHFAPPAGGLWNALGAQDRPCYKETVGRGLYIRPCAPPALDAPSPNAHRRGAQSCPQPGRIYAVLAVDAPGPGGMRAMPPEAFDGGAAGIGGLFGRLIAAPTGAPAAVSRRRGGYQPPGPHRRNWRAFRYRNPAPGGMRACRPTPTAAGGTALHAEAGGPMWASAPTRGTKAGP